MGIILVKYDEFILILRNDFLILNCFHNIINCFHNFLRGLTKILNEVGYDLVYQIDIFNCVFNEFVNVLI